MIAINKHRFSVSAYFAAFVAVMLVIDTTNLTLLALICVLIHECGHLLMLKIYKVPIRSVSMKLFGISIEVENRCFLNYKKEAIVSLAGPAANLLTALIAFALHFFFLFPGQFDSVCETLVIFSLIIGALNFLPIGSLDGANALNALLLLKTTPERAEKFINFTSAVFIIPLMCCGVYVFISTKFNISLLAVSVYLIAFLLKKKAIIKEFTCDREKSPKKRAEI